MPRINKKSIIALILACSIILLSSCGTPENPSQAKIEADAAIEPDFITETSLNLDKNLAPLPGAGFILKSPGHTQFVIPCPEGAGVDLYMPELGLLELALGSGTIRVAQSDWTGENAETGFFQYQGAPAFLSHRKINDDTAITVFIQSDSTQLYDLADIMTETVDAVKPIDPENPPFEMITIDGIGLEPDYISISSLQSNILTLTASNDNKIFFSPMTVKPGNNLTPMDTGGVTLYGTDFVHEDTGLQGWVLPGNTGNFIVLSPSGRELMGTFQNDIVIQEAPTMAPGSP